MHADSRLLLPSASAAKAIVKYCAILAVALTAALAVPASAAGTNTLGVTDYSGNWWNSSQNGMGLSIIEQNNIIFILWFVYSAQGQPMFLQLGGQLQKNSQSQDTLSGALAITNGTQPMNFDPSKITAKSVGSASITFSDPYHATMTYQYQDPTGGPLQTGTLTLSQLQFGCNLPAMWNGTFCVVPKGVVVTDPKAVPAGCLSSTDQCWQDAVKNGTVKFIATSAKAVGVNNRPVMFAYFINGGGFTATSGPYSATLFWADTGEPMFPVSVSNGFGSPVDWAKGTDNGLLFHQADGTCWETRWFPPTTQSGVNSGVWANVPASCS